MKIEATTNRFAPWEAEDTRRDQGGGKTEDPRHIPKSFSKYDLALISNWNDAARPRITDKAEKKCNIDHVALLSKKQFSELVNKYRVDPEMGGVPGYIDAFLRGEKGGRTEGFQKHPEQFCATSFDPKMGGFIISPNPSNIPEKGKTYISDASAVVSQTRGQAGFGLVAYWIPPGVYSGAVFHDLFGIDSTNQSLPPGGSGGSNRQELVASIGSDRFDRQERLVGAESNKSYSDRTGLKFLSIPLDLGREHVPMLRELKATILSHLATVYDCDVEREKVEIFTHGPIYANESAGLHFHARVNNGRHPVENDLRIFDIDDCIHQLREIGGITNFATTTSGKFISFNVAAKQKWAREKGIDFELVPNVWKRPENADARSFRLLGADGPLFMRDKSAVKYDSENIAIVTEEDLQTRIKAYGKNEILPNFIYNFFMNDGDAKALALRSSPEQFAATSFTEHGGIVIMPNRQYVDGKQEAYKNPADLNDLTRARGGMAFVAYWIPPDLFEATPVFKRLFGNVKSSSLPPAGCRENISEYEDRVGKKFITNPIDLKPDHAPMIREYIDRLKNYLCSVYGVGEQDKLESYVHAPVYGNKTAGLHFHARVNQVLPAGERDVSSLQIDKVLNILESTSAHDAECALLAAMCRTASGKYISYSPAWNMQQYTSVGANNVKLVSNPWKRPGI
ncbi:hypothetical protein OHC51_03500 [Stenotrophomonas indicatrix]|uniref:hypothetical protein n=1 Tax=Stenotrophomonas indicatrix TaxID=2045451 RepID=UPI00300A67F9